MNDLYVLLQLILSCIRIEDEGEATARKGVVYVHVCVCIHKHTRLGRSGGMLPHKIFEVASEGILGQKQSCSSYMACRTKDEGEATGP